MGNVVITDSRPKWMVKEDKQVACMTRCKMYRHCRTRVGFDCRNLGGRIKPQFGRD